MSFLATVSLAATAFAGLSALSAVVLARSVLPKNFMASRNTAASSTFYVTVGESRRDPARLYYEIAGPDSARNRVLFVMGWGASGGLWRFQVNHLMEKRNASGWWPFSSGPDPDRAVRILTFDNRGCGRSETTERHSYTTDMLAEDAIDLMRGTGFLDDVVLGDGTRVPPRIVVLGVSMGGMIAQKIGARLEGRVGGLVLCSTYGRWEAIAAGNQAIRNMGVYLDVGNLVQNPKEAMGSLYAPDFIINPLNIARLTPLVLSTLLASPIPNPVGIMQQGRACASHSLSPSEAAAIRRLPGPVVVVHGDRDRVVPFALGKRLAEGFLGGKAEGVWMQGVGHVPPHERSRDEFNALVDRVIDAAGEQLRGNRL
ncbi:Alpha/Beta hydrolase protein [Hyaloraphidium curvatum]|nr:Alpha/Beta hydrolase protein [Hyaloraphidium curvatum]